VPRPGRAGKRRLVNYRNLFDLHVRPAIVTLEDGTRVGPLGGLSITEIAADVIQAWVTRMGKRKYKISITRRGRAGGPPTAWTGCSAVHSHLHRLGLVALR
jgi:hypothetical protein